MCLGHPCTPSVHAVNVDGGGGGGGCDDGGFGAAAGVVVSAFVVVVGGVAGSVHNVAGSSVVVFSVVGSVAVGSVAVGSAVVGSAVSAAVAPASVVVPRGSNVRKNIGSQATISWRYELYVVVDTFIIIYSMTLIRT